MLKTRNLSEGIPHVQMENINYLKIFMDGPFKWYTVGRKTDGETYAVVMIICIQQNFSEPDQIFSNNSEETFRMVHEAERISVIKTQIGRISCTIVTNPLSRNEKHKPYPCLTLQ